MSKSETKSQNNHHELPFTPLFIDGRPCHASTNATFAVRNPYSSTVVGTSASASRQDCTNAIDSASKAFLTWEHTSLSERRDIFLKAADLLALDKYKNVVFKALTEETASVDYWNQFNWVSSIRSLRNAASSVNELKGESFPSLLTSGYTIVQRRAHGVIFGIAPWNAPLILSMRAIAAPIICGNTVVLKSSEYSPRSHAIVAELLHEAGLPNGVLNYISMSRESSPALTADIIAHPAVRKINFTGSDRVGKILAAEAAKYLKPCVFELGGKAPAVLDIVQVLNDAQIEEASRAIVSGAMTHSGQVCMSTERVIVQREASQALILAVTEICRTLKAGDPTTDSSAKLSALFSSDSAENLLNVIRQAKALGAEILLGNLEREGAVVQPHLLTGVKPGMELWDRESFGPVIMFSVVESIDEAVQLANTSDYSLVASVWTRDVNTALDVASRIRASCTNINGTTIHSEPAAPLFGLGGATGYGCFDINNFTDKRAIVIHPAHREYPLVG